MRGRARYTSAAKITWSGKGNKHDMVVDEYSEISGTGAVRSPLENLSKNFL